MPRARTFLLLAAALTSTACWDQATSPIVHNGPDPAFDHYGASEVPGATDLGTLGGSVARAVAINDAGTVAGWSTQAFGNVMAFSWMAGSNLVVLPTLGGAFGQAVAINAHGQIAGRSSTLGGLLRAVVWNNLAAVDLGTPEGVFVAIVRAQNINDLGEVVGHSQDVFGQWHPFVWQSATGMRSLPQLPGNTGDAVALNEVGQIVGWSTTLFGQRRAVVWVSGPPSTITDLGTLGGDSSVAVAINETGQVVGTAKLGSGSRRAFLWQGGTMQDLGTLGGSFSEAVAINDAGVVVGNSTTSDERMHAFLWEAGAMHDLGTLGGATSRASALSASGQVVGWSDTDGGEVHAFVWQAGNMTDLGTLGGDSSAALAVNNALQAAGWAKDATGKSPAAVWDLPAVVVNTPPTADAGPDQNVECFGHDHTDVVLDGSASTDSDGDALSYVWTDATGKVLGDEASPIVSLALGTHTLTLTVSDGEASATDEVVITIEDTTGPIVTAALVRLKGGDDGGRFRVEYACSDSCDASASVVSARLNGIAVANGQVVELERDDDGQEVEYDDGVLKLEAARFALVVTCVDASGNQGMATVSPTFRSDDDDDDDDDDRKRRRRPKKKRRGHRSGG